MEVLVVTFFLGICCGGGLIVVAGGVVALIGVAKLADAMGRR